MLAAAMLNSNANQAKLFTPATTYSPPTCHSALLAARNKQQISPKFEIGSDVRPPETVSHKFSNGSFISELSGRFERTSFVNDNNVVGADENDNVEIDDAQPTTRKLGRTWSVGRLVNNFESPSASFENPSAPKNPVRDFRTPKLSVPSLPLSNAGSKPFLAPKPPSLVGVVKPMLRHTVSALCT